MRNLEQAMLALGRFGSYCAVLVAALVLGACGGGSDSPPLAVNTAPTANAGTDQTVVRNTTVTLSGSATDTGGTANLTYSWAQTAGTSVTITSASAATATLVAPNTPAGEALTFSLTVTDSGGLSDTDTVTVTVAPNVAPVADAGADQTLVRNVVATLSGSATDDTGTGGLTFAWTQTAGPAVALTGAATPTATLTTPDVVADAALVFSLIVTDSDGLASVADDVTITVLFNTPPTVDAGTDQTVEQNSNVTLTAAATDDNPLGDLTYVWTQTAGTTVVLADADSATASFTAPPTTGSQLLSFEISVTDANGEVATDTIDITVLQDLTASVISGNVQYEFVPFDGSGLDYDQIQLKPVRGATVQLIDAGSSAVIDSGVLDAQGGYSFVVPASSNVFVRVRAELKRAGTPAWDMEVRDNTSNTGAAFADRPLYVLDGTTFVSTVGAQTVNLQAPSGWTGASYGNTRAAAPFAILDTIYNGVQLVLSADPDAVFAPLDAFWSVNNTPTVTEDRNLDTGEIGTSFYRSDLDSLFLLGDAGADTEEFDTHVVAHEWGHYFEDNFSRSDSTGGSHTLSARLDPRLAFGEGFGNAVSAMINGTPTYFDTQGTQQAGGFSFSLESNRATSNTRGWFNEGSVQAVLYDLFDSDDDAGDTVSLGFAPLYQVLTNEQATGTPFTTIFSFIEGLRDRNPGEAAAIDALLQTQRIVGDNDGYGSSETEAAGQPALVLPIYTVIPPDGTVVNVCSSTAFDSNNDGNKLAVRRFLRIPITTAGNYEVDIVTTNPPAIGQSDPDAFVSRAVLVGGGDSGVPNRETFTLQNLQPGDYVMELYEFSYASNTIDAISQPDNQTCFDVTVTP